MGCINPIAEGKVSTYLSPALGTSRITSVAVFPLLNSFDPRGGSSLNTGDMLDRNSMFQAEFARKNPKATLITSSASTDLLNRAGLVDAYGSFVSVYRETGVPNTQTLNNMGRTLKADAIIQGFIERVVQTDGRPGSIPGDTKLSVKYVMFSTANGTVPLGGDERGSR